MEVLPVESTLKNGGWGKWMDGLLKKLEEQKKKETTNL